MAERSLSYKISLFGYLFAGVVVLLLAVQNSAGISNVVFSLPLAVALAHNGGAALLLLTLVMLVHTMGQKKHLS